MILLTVILLKRGLSFEFLRPQTAKIFYSKNSIEEGFKKCNVSTNSNSKLVVNVIRCSYHCFDWDIFIQPIKVNYKNYIFMFNVWMSIFHDWRKVFEIFDLCRKVVIFMVELIYIIISQKFILLMMSNLM